MNKLGFSPIIILVAILAVAVGFGIAWVHYHATQTSHQQNVISTNSSRPPALQFATTDPTTIPNEPITKLSQIPEDAKGRTDFLVFSKDGSRVAYPYCNSATNRCQMILNNDYYGKEYAWTELATFSPDGRQFAYAGSLGSGEQVVFNDKEQQIFFRTDYLTPSPDSKHFAYRGIKKTILGLGYSYSIVIDGKEEKYYDAVGYPVFSPDGSKVIYAAESGGEMFMVVNGIEGKRYNIVGADTGHNLAPVITTTPTFSLDGTHFAYIARTGLKYFAVVDGEEGKLYDLIDGLTWSGDGKHLAYMAEEGGKQFMVLDGKEGSHFQTVGDPALSFDGMILVYFVSDERKNFGRESLVINGVRKDIQPAGFRTSMSNRSYSNFAKPIISTDGKNIVYASSAWVSGKGTQDYLVASGSLSSAYDIIWHEDIFFSPENKLVYKVSSGGKQSMVVNGVVGGKYDYIWQPSFRTDGKLSYGAKLGNDLLWVVDQMK